MGEAQDDRFVRIQRAVERSGGHGLGLDELLAIVEGGDHSVDQDLEFAAAAVRQGNLQDVPARVAIHLLIGIIRSQQAELEELRFELLG